MKKITLFKYLLSAILLLGFLPNMFAQQQNANWYFGNTAGINFNDGTATPTLLTDGAMNAPTGCASVSDDLGALLFYTDGVTVWNKNHVPMLNGNLIGDVSVSQSVVIIPNPANAAQYYVFSNSADNIDDMVNDMDSWGLRYSVVDMTLEGGLGDVDSVVKDVSLLTNCSEKMTAIINPYDNSYWLVAFGPSSDLTVYDTFYTFKIDTNGDINMPVESNFFKSINDLDFDRNNPIHLAKAAISLPFKPTINSYAPYAGGQMKISPDFNTLALVHNVNDRYQQSAEAVFIFTFNPITGELASDSIRSYYLNGLFDYFNTYYYGLEFSPDSQQIYVSTFEKDDIDFGEIISISNFALGSTPFFNQVYVPTSTRPIYSLQLGIDNKIYVAREQRGNLDVIYNPNDPSVQNIDYREFDFSLGSGDAGQGLPQLVPPVFVQAKPSDIEKKAAKPIVKENPFRNELKLKFKYIQDYTIEYHDAMGALIKTEVYEMTNRKIHKVDTQAWGDGVYYVRITGAETSEIFYNTAIKAQ